MIEMTETIQTLREDKRVLNNLAYQANARADELQKQVKQQEERIRELESGLAWYAMEEMKRQRG